MNQKNYKLIPLTKNQFAKVDTEDYEWLSQYSWRAIKKPTYYAQRSWNENGKTRSIKMHREILKIYDPSVMVDHINGDTLDNRKENLRLCSNSQNQANRDIPITNTTGFKGVQYIKNPRYKYKKYKAAIVHQGKQHFLGCFYTAEDAAKAYNEAAIKFFGPFAKVNKL